MESDAAYRRVKTAIFVDFDNMFGGLKAMDASAAESFATDPGRLLAWLEEGEDLDGRFRRRFLLKACYLNPDVFRKYRSFFVSAGFRVIDCPSLTQKGKSAADIHLVLDVVDTLEHKTRFEEFIICSSDADFTPLMVKLRAHDRRTVMVAAGPAAGAYQSVCDEAVPPIQIIDAFAKKEPVLLADEDPQPDAAPPDLAEPGPGAEDPAAALPQQSLTGEQVAAAAAAVRSAVSVADGALRGPAAASAAIHVVPHIAHEHWGNPDGFAGFVSVQLPELTVIRTASGGWLIDPARHSAEDFLDEDFLADDLPAKISRVTKVPRLSSEQYAAMFEELATLSAEPEPPSLNRMGAEIRDRAAARGVPFPRTAANFVIQGLIYAGADPRNHERGASEFGARCRDNVLVLCDRADLELDEPGKATIDEWLLGALPPSEASGP